MTPQQKKLYDIIKAELDASGVCPSFEEMREAMGLKSKSRIWQLVCGLEDSGHIIRRPNRARSIQIAPRDITVDDLLPPALRWETQEIVKAARKIKTVPWRKGKTVTVSKESYYALRKALVKLGAV